MYHYDPDLLHPLDNEVGRLVRFLPHVETAVLLLVSAAFPDKGWIELSTKRSSDLVDLLEQAVARFPLTDHSLLVAHIGDAREVNELRNYIVHGRWRLVDPERELYEVERVLTKSQARKATGRSDWPDEEYPASYMPMNLATVARTLRLAQRLHSYLDKHQDRWEEHFAVQ